MMSLRAIDMSEPESEKSPDRDEKPSKKTRSFGERYRESAMLAAPTIIIVYPLVGFFIGWLTVKYWSFPEWVMLLTLVGGVAEGIREIFRLNKRISQKNEPNGD
ncbi:MAG TPA: hypothetical protein ENN67_06165 [Firmicutes bacterium]|nr:hypothetical protein [Bacillota bacterium]